MPSENLFLDALTDRGVLIDVSVRFWRAKKKLNPEDLGLSAAQVDARLFSLGHKRLLPKEALQKLQLLEGRAHALVDENTFPFLGGIAHYLTNAKLQEVSAKLDSLKGEFEAARSEFMAGYANQRRHALIEWRAAAEHLGVDPELLVAKIAAAFPPVEGMGRYFGFGVNLFQVTTPELPRVDLVDLGTRQELIEMRQRTAQTAKAQIETSCRDFIADAVATLREQTAKLAEEMLGTISDTGYVHQKTLNRLVKFIEHYKELNFAGDGELTEQLDRVRQEFLSRTAEEYRDSKVAREHLVHGLEGLRQKARELATQPATALVAQFGQLGQRKLDLAA